MQIKNPFKYWGHLDPKKDTNIYIDRRKDLDTVLNRINDLNYYAIIAPRQTGKTTFLQAINAMLGEYAMQTPTETLLVKRRGAIPNDVARLKGARFVTASEAESEQRFAESLIKQMTGGDTLSARFLHQVRADTVNDGVIAK